MQQDDTLTIFVYLLVVADGQLRMLAKRVWVGGGGVSRSEGQARWSRDTIPLWAIQ